MASALQEKVVIIVGRAGVGKSTIGNTILSRERFSIHTSCFEDSQSNVGFGIVTHKSRYHIHIFDSIGLEEESRRKATKEIQQYVSNNKRPINLVLFVFKKGRYTEAEKATFEHITSQLGPHVTSISALIVTHCECDNDVARRKMIDEIRQNELTKEIANYTKKGIFTVGFPNAESVSPSYLPHMKESMEKDKECMLKLIDDSSSTVDAKSFFRRLRRLF